jgi:epoxyqueuosine reductase
MLLSVILKERAKEIGFDLVGISPVEVPGDLEFSRRWVHKGFGGEMHYLENPRRDDPRQILPSAKSVVCVGLVYNTPLPYSTETREGKLQSQKEVAESSSAAQHATAEGAAIQSPHGWISRYAWGGDYHSVMRAKLEALRTAIEELAPGVQTRVYVDTGPVVERAFARFSGIGWMGKNTCLINEQKGSWFFLGVILTSLEIEPDAPAPDRCGSCTRCLEACPTRALVEPYMMDASRCIAYFNIELKGSIPAEFRSALGANVFGCDICQDVCPWNSKSENLESEVRSQTVSIGSSPVHGHQPCKGYGRPGAPVTSNPEFQPLEIEHEATNQVYETTSLGQYTGEQVSSFERAFSLFSPSLEDLASLTEEDFRRVFRRSPIQRVKYRGWLRNLCVVMGNSGDSRFVPWLERARKYPDPLVREHAAWALGRIKEQD